MAALVDGQSANEALVGRLRAAGQFGAAAVASPCATANARTPRPCLSEESRVREDLMGGEYQSYVVAVL